MKFSINLKFYFSNNYHCLSIFFVVLVGVRQRFNYIFCRLIYSDVKPVYSNDCEESHITIASITLLLNLKSRNSVLFIFIFNLFSSISVYNVQTCLLTCMYCRLLKCIVCKYRTPKYFISYTFRKHIYYRRKRIWTQCWSLLN